MAKVGGRVFERKMENGRSIFDPIENAFVFFLPHAEYGRHYSALTDARGHYLLEVPAGNYDTDVTRHGYERHNSKRNPGWHVIRDVPVNTTNFFLEREVEPVQTRFRKKVTLDVLVKLPDYTADGVTGVERGIETFAVVDNSRGTVEFEDIPDFENEDGIRFEASVETWGGQYDRASGHASLMATCIVDPNSAFLGKDIFLRDVMLSTRTTTGIPTYDGSPLNRGRKYIVLAGEGMTSQGRLRKPDGGVLDAQRAVIKVIAKFEDLDGLT